MKTRILAVLLVVVMVVALVPANVFAAETAPARPEAIATVTGRDITVTTVDGEQVPATFTMNFKAVEPTEEQFEYYKKWYADYVLTVNKDVTGMDGYLIGQYDWYNTKWLKIAVETEDVIIKANEPFKVMYNLAQSFDENSTYISYEQIINSVKDFDCGIYFTPEFLQNNPDLKVTLELRIYNLHNMSENYRIGRAYNFYPLFVSQQPESVTVKAGETAQLSVAAIGTGLTYRWQKSNDGETNWYNTTMTGCNTTTLEVPAQEYNDVYYRCLIIDGHNQRVTSEIAKVTMEEFTVESPEDVTANPNDIVELTANATGDNLSYCWQKSNDGETGWYNTTIEGCKTATLKVPAVKYNDVYYRCVITDNTSGTKKITEPAKITLNGPKFTLQPENVTAANNTVAQLNVEATGDGLSYCWQKSNDGQSGWYNTSMTGCKTPSLEVTAVKYNDVYYRCVITDAYGQKATSQIVKVTLG
ncbi:MAG: hypothetical protein IKJ94_06650 [Oscillospiraceae bacterium]|nr:hypothetical protein [Oscillospiraceae bacterium]